MDLFLLMFFINYQSAQIFIYLYIYQGLKGIFGFFFKYHCVLALSASIEYICYVSMAIINIILF